MKTKLFLSIVLCFIWVASFSQQDSPPKVKSTNLIIEKENPSGAGNSSSTGLVSVDNLGEECSIYLNENFVKGILTLNDETKFEDRSYRFNLFSQQMEFILDGDTAAIGNPEELRILQFDNKDFIYTEYNYNGKVSKGYMELLVDGDYSLLLHSGIKYTFREDTRDSKGEPVEKYYLKEDYFMSYKNEPANLILLNKKDVINTVQIPGKNIKEYMKENNMHMKDEADLIEVFKYCNAPKE